MKQSRPASRVRKHRNDHNNGKNGFVTGNVRYKRSSPLSGRAMGKARASASSERSWARMPTPIQHRKGVMYRAYVYLNAIKLTSEAIGFDRADSILTTLLTMPGVSGGGLEEKVEGIGWVLNWEGNGPH